MANSAEAKLVREIERQRQLDTQVFERARAVQSNLSELVEASDRTRHILHLQAAMILRVREDIKKTYYVDIAKSARNLVHREVREYHDAAFRSLEELSDRMRRRWLERKAKRDVDGTVAAGLMTFACEFWLVDMFALTSDFSPLLLCARSNHILLAGLPASEVIEAAKPLRNIFYQTWDYPIASDSWPLIDIDAAVADYVQATREGPLAEQFLRALRDASR